MASIECIHDWQSTKNTALEKNCHMFNNSDMSDVSFTCKGSDKILYAHKYVLGTSSMVFHAMFYGEMAEKEPVIHLPDTNEDSLHEFLRFIYTEQCGLTTDNADAIMYLAGKYNISSLYKKSEHFMLENLNPENALDFLETAIRFDTKVLEKRCLKVIQFNTTKVLACHDSFNKISQKTLKKILKQDTLHISEVELFKAVLEWSKSQCSHQHLEATPENQRSVIGDAIYSFRFFSMTKEEFIENVSESGLLTSEEKVTIYEKFLVGKATNMKWTLPNRKMENIVRFCRFPEMGNGFRTLWEYGGAADRLQICVNSDVILRGVRLFGEQGSEYVVELKVKEAKEIGSYLSERNEDGVPGFDVMLREPVLLTQNEVVTLAATINGPDSCSGENGLSSVTHNGVTVTFIDGQCATNKTCKNRGQFYNIILAI